VKKTKLFCIPYSGGSTITYRSWRKRLDNSIELIPIELPGRGVRLKTPLCDNFDDLLNDVCNSVINELDDSEYALFGHSLGSLLSYELYYKILDLGYKKPKHIFFSAHTPSPLGKSNPEVPPLYDFSDERFIQVLNTLDGLPKELLENQKLLNYYLPILRNDIKISLTYKPSVKKEILDCDISILFGEEDRLIVYDAHEWVEFTDRNCAVYSFREGHFFINTFEEEVIGIINNTLKNV